MNLDTYDSPDDLYLARGDEVNPNRPLFTGDVFAEVEIPGVEEGGMAIVVAHPCAFRLGGGQVGDRLLVARVRPFTKQGTSAWRSRYLDKMPLTDLAGTGFWAGHLDLIGRCRVDSLGSSGRIACLSSFGINVLQQRLTCHMTRAEVPTSTFDQAFSHTFDEADLLEEWTDALAESGWSPVRAAAEFERFIRSGNPRWQDRLKDPQMRSAVRRACRSETNRLLETGLSPEDVSESS